MGDPSGFLEHPREPTPKADPKTRLRTYDEILQPASEEHLRAQAARCMDCGIPFCQSGTGCPIDNRIPEWNDLVFKGRWREASARLHATNNFPEFTGRVCPAPCEGACVLQLEGAPVTIENLEQAIVDRAFAEGWVVAEPPLAETGHSVAIVGSGPAGLTAAQQLRRVGHEVTVFERADAVGGLLHYGIPNMKLDKTLVARRVGQLRAEGVAFETGVNVDAAKLEALRESHDAVLLTTGATQARDLAIPGRELEGIHLAMEFLTESTRALLAGEPPRLSAKGRHVLVIGGGDTGTDCIATALRQECASLTTFELMPRPPDERGAQNPWPQWPRVFRVDYGHAEASALFGDDPREFAVLTESFLGEGRVSGVRTVGVRFDAGMEKVAGSERVVDTDLVLLALGFTGPEPIVGAPETERGLLDAPLGTYATSEAGLFAAGDCRRGQSLVVWAIAEGRGAARAVDEFLMGESDLPVPRDAR